MNIYVLENQMKDSMRSVLNGKLLRVEINRSINRARFIDVIAGKELIKTSQLVHETKNGDKLTLITKSGTKYTLINVTKEIDNLINKLSNKGNVCNSDLNRIAAHNHQMIQNMINQQNVQNMINQQIMNQMFM